MTDPKIEVLGTLMDGANPGKRLPDPNPGDSTRGNQVLPKVPGLVERLAAAEARSDDLKSENALYLLQIEQIQQELERQFERNQWQGGRIGEQQRQLAELQRQLAEPQRQLAELQKRLAELQKRLELESAPWRDKLSRAIRVYWKHWAAIFSQPRTGWARISDGRESELLRSSLAIKLSGLFDEGWYLETYPDVAQTGQDPVEHYLRFGAAESRNPSALFDSQWYLTAHPDVAEAGVNPLVHYVLLGRHEGRRPVRSIA